jgi:hypothetical protein
MAGKVRGGQLDNGRLPSVAIRRQFNRRDYKAFPCREAYSTGLHTIDVHHRYLFELTNNLSQSLRSAADIGKIATAFKALE